MSNKENREPENGYAFHMERNSPIFGSDEDTEDASETAMIIDEEEYTQIREQMYRDKSEDLQNQLKQLENFAHPAYINGEKALKEEYVNRQFRNEVVYAMEAERIKREHELEKEAAYKEFNQKRKELKENLISDLEEKRRIYEVERDSMDIANESLDIVQNPIRKLRRRANDPLSAPEPKRKKTSPSLTQINFQLTEEEVNEDLAKIYEGKEMSSYELNAGSEESPNEMKNSDIRVENGKLYYEKYWYHRGQQIYYEDKEAGGKNSAVISTINPTEVWVKRTSDNEKCQIYISQLLKGTITLKRRSA